MQSQINDFVDRSKGIDSMKRKVSRLRSRSVHFFGLFLNAWFQHTFLHTLRYFRLPTARSQYKT